MIFLSQLSSPLPTLLLPVYHSTNHLLTRLLVLRLQPLHHSRPRDQLCMPLGKARELGRGIQIRDQPSHHLIPWDPGEICVRDAVAREIRGALLSEVGVNDAEDAADLVGVAELGRRQLLMVEVGEPGLLSEVGALARHLEVQPLQLGVLGRAAGRVQLVVDVVLVDEVLQDGAGLGGKISGVTGRGEGGTNFSQRDACVGVLDGGDSAVGVEADEGLFLQHGIAANLGLVGEAELFEENGDFAWVGALDIRLVGRLKR